MTWKNEIKKEHQDLIEIGQFKLVNKVEDAIKDLDRLEDIINDLDVDSHVELSKLAKSIIATLSLFADNEKGIEELKDWGFKEIELGLNIDKIDSEEEPSNDNYIITITESDISKANALYKELKDRGLKVKIKL